MPGTLALYETTTVKGALIVGQPAQGPAPPPPIALALHNALLLTTPPTLLLAAGSFTATPAELDTGGLLLSFGLDTLLPTLPDPYAANFLPGRREPKAPAAPSSVVLATILWSPTAATQLNFGDTALAPESWHVTPLPATPGGQQNELVRVFDDSLGSANPTLFLLDVSSNSDQLGVGMTIAPAGVAPAPATQAPSISQLDLVAPCLDLRVFTAPAVQWEPVVTIQNPNVLPSPFPSPAGFLDDGGPTLLGAADVTLVPVAPAPLLDQVVSAYDDGGAGAALFTLPFGMVAVAILPQRPAHPSPFFRRPGLAEVQPAFTPQNMTGGRQVSLTAPTSILQIGGRSPSLPGAAVQLRNLVDQGGNPVKDQNGNPLSVLGPEVDQPFNLEFGPGSRTASLPVTRIDLSGYGASSFSAWADPTANWDAVVQVRFNMMVGRASHEVVQVKSILGSGVGFAVVVRTVTIDRQDGSEIYRYDSGWVAATPATWTLAPGLTVHPGAVLGAQNIREIRDTSQTFRNGPVALTAVYFDADVQLDGVVSGATAGLVPSTGQLGFVLTAPPNTALQAGDLAALIASQGALGGPVDCVIAVAGTAQTMRLSRVEVANAPHAGAMVPQEFAAVARGSLVLPAQGSWSVLTRTDTASEPTPIDADRGVPLIRQGPAGGPPGNAPWRFAEPADLWLADTPAVDYCLLHATDATRVLFPRPKVEVGTTALTSTQAPLLADGFALLEATGVCPRQDSCLVFPDANYSLQIGGAGVFTLAGVAAPFAPSVPSRTLANGTAATIGFEYADDTGIPCQVSVAIQPNAWSIGLKGINVRLDMLGFNGLLRAVGDVQATSGSSPSFGNPRVVLGPDAKPLTALITFLEALGLVAPFDLSFSNSGWTKTKKYKLKAGLQLNLPMTKPFPIPVGTLFGAKIKINLKLGFGNAASSEDALTTATSQWLGYLSFKGSGQFEPLPPLPVYTGLLIVFKMEADFPAGKVPEKETLALQVGWIVSVGNDELIPGVLGLEASIAAAIMAVVTTTTPRSFGLGIAFILSASGKILEGLIGITFTAEADGVLILTPTPVTAQVTFDIQVDVSVCWFLDTTFEARTQWTEPL